MKKLFGMIAALGLMAGAGSAMAEGTQQKDTTQKNPPAHKTTQALSTGRQEIAGHIVDIDNKKGNVKVQTDQGQLEFQFPPASLQGLNQGDPVRLEVQIKKQPAAPKPPPAEKLPQQGEKHP